MRISYNWLNEYLPALGGLKNGAGVTGVVFESPGILPPEKLSNILTSVGLEVESMEKYEEFKGGLEGLIVGEVMDCIKHPEADKLTVTKVDTGNGELLQIVCGAPNVAPGQKVVVATIGTTIFPSTGEPVTMKKAKIRGIESEGMLCAEDEIGIGDSHNGIIILSEDSMKGTLLKDVLKAGSDWIFEIGLTPNRIDAMSHIGVAKDVCAWLSLHDKRTYSVKYPSFAAFKSSSNTHPINVRIENSVACQRYSGVSISGVEVKDSPEWLQKRLKSIGVRPVNNIVDITNFVLHETGQPLHAFDLNNINNKGIMVKTLPENTPFVTLDGKERKLHKEDLMICDGAQNPMCFGGVFGGIGSGVTSETNNIFLESAWFDPSSIRRTSLRHGLRTDAAIRFEKGVDISNTIQVLKRATLLIMEVAGGKIASDIVDLYPNPNPKKEITLKNHYLKKISGKNYHADTVKNILQSLGFEILKEGMDDIRLAVPYSKPGIQLPADIIEEIMRIDGLDNVDIPTAITITPAIENLAFEEELKERTANSLAGLGFSEIFTNSITNSHYYTSEVLQSAIKIINSLSEELDIMRPSLLETGLECIQYNINRKNSDLLLFEFGKIYSQNSANYIESEQLAIFASGNKTNLGWRNPAEKSDLYYIKGVCERLFRSVGITNLSFATKDSETVLGLINDSEVAILMEVNPVQLKSFSIKQPVFFANIDWEKVISISKKQSIAFQEIPKFPVVHRDLSLIVNKEISYSMVEKATAMASVSKLSSMKLFDVFESEKIGLEKKSFAINFTFWDNEKTLTDKEIDSMINKLVDTYEKELGAEIRKA